MDQVLLNAARSEFMARLDKYNANLQVYLRNPVGVGEHPDIVEVVVDCIEHIHDAEGCIDTIDNIIAGMDE